MLVDLSREQLQALRREAEGHAVVAHIWAEIGQKIDAALDGNQEALDA